MTATTVQDAGTFVVHYVTTDNVYGATGTGMSFQAALALSRWLATQPRYDGTWVAKLDSDEHRHIISHRPLVFVPSHSHSLSDVVAYVVRRTDWSDGFPCTRTDVARVDGATNYAEALDAVYDVRAEAGDQQYGVIDTVYGCGCDSGAVYTSY